MRTEERRREVSPRNGGGGGAAAAAAAVAAGGLFVLIASGGLMLAATVTAAVTITTAESLLCGPHGLMHANRTCSCVGGWGGPDCGERVCPFGSAWVGYEGHGESVECSNAGTCNRLTGLCACESGFEGSACEKRSCPSTDLGGTCNGRGRCVSMAAAGQEWDGRSLVVPDASYESNWDSYRIYGCLCDEGYSGYDCSLRDCPRGDDPLTSAGDQNEVIRLVCQADEGSFVFRFRGHTSADIPFDATYGLLQRILEDMPSVSAVDVTLGGSGLTVCESGVEVVTTLEFTHDFGPLPVAKVEAGTDLALGGGNPTLALETHSEISCPACASCQGGVYLLFGSDETSSLAHDSNAATIQAELEGMPTLNSAYGAIDDISVSFSSGSALCDSASVITTSIVIRASYGNLPDFTVVSSVYDGVSLKEITWSGPKGTKENEFCSNHGTCDRTTGVCSCHTTESSDGSSWIRWSSSDGYGAAGTRGDCGFYTLSDASLTMDSNSCLLDEATTPACSGNGLCSSDGICECYEGYWGHNCSLRSCPLGKAWFDEPYSEDMAHSLVECSGAGICNESSGQCTCADGHQGAACERFTALCPRGCSSHGRCLPLWSLTGEAGSSAYGTSSYSVPHASFVAYDDASTWDYDVLYGCLCDGYEGWGEGPSSGPIGWTSGFWKYNVRLPGWKGVDCSLRSCPRGDNPSTTDLASDEVQVIGCTATSGTFTLSFRDQTTAAIDYNEASPAEIETALEDLSTVSDVSVSFIGGISTACDSGANGATIGIQVTFLGEHGDVPDMTSSPSYTVTETVQGNKETTECSGKGSCDTATGTCLCWPGYYSSDGAGNPGNRGDCSYFFPNFELTSTVEES